MRGKSCFCRNALVFLHMPLDHMSQMLILVDKISFAGTPTDTNTSYWQLTFTVRTHLLNRKWGTGFVMMKYFPSVSCKLHKKPCKLTIAQA